MMFLYSVFICDIFHYFLYAIKYFPASNHLSGNGSVQMFRSMPFITFFMTADKNYYIRSCIDYDIFPERYHDYGNDVGNFMISDDQNELLTETTADAIRSMKIRGAGLIARKAAESLGNVAESYHGNDVDELKFLLYAESDALLNARPTAVSLHNGVSAVMKAVDEAGDGIDAAGLRLKVMNAAAVFCHNSVQAVSEIARTGAALIKDGDRILTHCNSKAALAPIIEAHRQGKKIEVYATESRPWRQGLLTIRDLAGAGVPVTLIIDSAVRRFMPDIDLIFVGADTICENGDLANKIGTSQIALAAAEAGVPFRSCAETYKFTPRYADGSEVPIEERDISEVISPEDLPEGVRVRNPVFDITPAEYITAFITEDGLVSPDKVRTSVQRWFGKARTDHSDDTYQLYTKAHHHRRTDVAPVTHCTCCSLHLLLTAPVAHCTCDSLHL